MQIQRATIKAGVTGLAGGLLASAVHAHPGHEAAVEHPVFHLHGVVEIAIVVALAALLLSAPRLRRRLNERVS